MRLNSRRWPAAAALLAAVFLPAVLLAESPGDRAQAEKKIEAITQDEKTGKLVAEPVKRAREALRRSKDARAAGDHYHGAMLDALGLEWASTAEAVTRSARIEREADAVQRKVAEAETKVIRARALLEETIARRGRARERLEALQREAEAKAAEDKPKGKKK